MIRPACDLVRPWGDFGVGRTEFGHDGMRVRAWYPSMHNRAAPRARAPRAWHGDRLDVGIPDAAPAATGAPFPVVIYYPGWPGTQLDNFDLLCYLASQGFAMLAVTYPAVPEDAVWDHSSTAAHEHTVARVTARLRARAGGTAALLEALRLRRVAPPRVALGDRLALDRVGLLGFSFGGAIAAEASRQDRTVAGVINLDGRHWGEALAQGVACPYLYIGEPLHLPSRQALTSARPEIRYNAALDLEDYTQLAVNLRRNGGIRIEVADAQHADFTDEALRRRIGRMLRGTAGRSRRVANLVRNYALAFFCERLLGQPSPLLAADAQLQPHAQFAVWNR